MKGKLILAVLLAAFLLRIVSLVDFPVGFNADEASFGYDAYSILKTGRDQWGIFLPLSLKSFGDYKSPLYSYLDVPFIAIFGLNEFAIRFPNVVIGTLAVLAVYLLAKKLFDGRVGTVAAVLLALNPW
jgi:4-amino-4-deoxy-L-arabinose transferase-like glycosyltransferase